MSRLTFREATDADYDAVMDILPDGWGGRDYLPDKYHEFIAEPDCRCFVCELEGEMIGFHAALIVDDGERMLRIGGRVKVAQQGQGVYHALQRHIYKSYRDYPKLKREAIVIVDNQADKIRDKYVNQLGYTEVQHKKRYLYFFEKSNPTSSVLTSRDQRVQELSGSDLATLMSSVAQCARLFPDGEIFLHCKPYKCMKANIRHFTHKTLILATGKETHLHGEFSQNSESEKRRDFLESVSLFTIGNSYKQRKGIHYNIELYGDNLDAFPLHLQRHLDRAKALNQEDLELFVHAYVTIDVTRIDDIMSKYGVKRQPDYIESVRLFERPFSLALKEVETDAMGE